MQLYCDCDGVKNIIILRFGFIQYEATCHPPDQGDITPKQFGFFNHKFIKSVHQRIKNRPILLKEHNADYLNSESINLRKEFISALNIAPQFGVFQTKFILDECVKFTSDWYISYFSNENIERVTEDQIEYFSKK